MRSFTALAFGLSLVDLSTARVAHKSHSDTQKRSGNVASFFNRLLRKSDHVEARAALAMTCNLDTYYDFVDDSDFGQGFCATLMNYPNVTIVSDYTPTRYARVRRLNFRKLIGAALSQTPSQRGS